MNRGISGLVLALGFPAVANAATITLDATSPVAEGTRFEYEASFTEDEGIQSGDQLIIFDFAGYVEGSAFTPGDWDFMFEFVSSPFVTPGFDDDASIGNLVFTYTGPDVNTENGPLDPFNLNGFGAVSTFMATVNDAYTTLTTKNNPEEAEGTVLVSGGTTLVPTDLAGGVPEPATWAMMVAGFGLVGAGVRRRRAIGRVTY